MSKNRITFSASFKSNESAIKIANKVASESSVKKEQGLFTRPLPLVDICLKLLLLNRRDEAIRFWPLGKANKLPYGLLGRINWQDYPFSGILVFGEGPEEQNVAISVNNKARCTAAAKLFRLKKAIF